MNFKKTLFLASTSLSRRSLLESACIPFFTVPQYANEDVPVEGRTLQEVVCAVADAKIACVQLPDGGIVGEKAFVLVADTLTQGRNGVIYAKPENKDHAISMLRAVKQGASVATAFIIDHQEWHNGQWHLLERKRQIVISDLVFDVPEDHVDAYLSHSIGMKTSGAIAVEGYGARYVSAIYGSYTNIMGLPLYDVRKALESMGFFGI